MNKLFSGRIPTNAEVNKLMGLPIRAGDTISYEQVCGLTGLSATETRFRSVTNAWRKRVFREMHLEVKPEGGQFVVLTPDEALSSGIKSFHRAGRALGRVSVKVSVINETELTEEKAATKCLLQRNIDAVADAARRAAKEVVAPRPHASLPRILPVKKAQEAS